MNINEAIEEYLAAKRQEGRTTATIRQYRWHLARLALAMARQNVIELAQLTKTLLRHWGADLLDTYAPATTKVAVTATRSWLTWCRREGYMTADLTGALRYPKVPMRLQRTVSGAEITCLLKACDLSTPLGVRDAAIVALLVDSGLRRRELVNLRMPALNLVQGWARVTRKGGDQGIVWFGAMTAQRLQEWLMVRPDVAGDGIDNVFVSVGGSLKGAGLTPEGIRGVLRRLGARAGVTHVSPHAFRRSFATLRLENGDSTRTVQALGGWKKIDMVERYSQALDLSRLARKNAPIDVLDGKLREIERVDAEHKKTQHL